MECAVGIYIIALELKQSKFGYSRGMYGLELTLIHTSFVCELAAQVQVSDGLRTQAVQAESSYGTGLHLPLWHKLLPRLVWPLMS